MFATRTQLPALTTSGAALDLALVAAEIRRVLADTPAEVVLFGSQARGEASRSSDIDIAIRAAQPLPHATLVALRAAFEDSGVVRRIDLVDWHAAGLALRESIAREGVLWTR